MIIDTKLLFGTLSVASNGTFPDVIDAKNPGDAIGDELYLHVRSYGEGVSNLASAAFTLQTCAASNFSSGVETLITVSGLTPVNGQIKWAGRVPVGMKRYLRVTLTPTAESNKTAAGCLTAFLTHGPQHSYEDFKA